MCKDRLSEKEKQIKEAAKIASNPILDFANMDTAQKILGSESASSFKQVWSPFKDCFTMLDQIEMEFSLDKEMTIEIKFVTEILSTDVQVCRDMVAAMVYARVCCRPLKPNENRKVCIGNDIDTCQELLANVPENILAPESLSPDL